MSVITTIAELEAIYGFPGETSLVKEVDHITPHYRTFIDLSPFAVLATSGPEGLDCSPRGDVSGFVRVHDSRTLMLPDRRAATTASIRCAISSATPASLCCSSSPARATRCA
jgi:uncharacterized protein